MKILTRKKQDKIIQRIIANQIIFDSQNKNLEFFEKYVDNSHQMAELVGGFNGVMKYLCAMKKYSNGKLSEHKKE